MRRRESVFWAIYAVVYDLMWDSPITRSVARVVADKVIPGGAVVDVGCGTGLVSREFVSRGYDVTGVDFSSAMLGRAVALGRVTKGYVALAGRTNLPSSCFDTVLLCNVIHLIDDPAPVLSEAARLVAPGGHIIVIWPTDTATTDRVARIERRLGRSGAESVVADQLRRAIGIISRFSGTKRHSESVLRAAVVSACGRYQLHPVYDREIHECQRVVVLLR